METEPRIIIGKRIAELRTQLGWSKYKLSQESGLSESTIGRLEDGKFSAKIDTLFAIAKAFNKRIDFI